MIYSLEVYTTSAVKVAVVAPSLSPSSTPVFVFVAPKHVVSAPVSPAPVVSKAVSPSVVASESSTTATSPSAWVAPMGIEESAYGHMYLVEGPTKRTVGLRKVLEEQKERGDGGGMGLGIRIEEVRSRGPAMKGFGLELGLAVEGLCS